LKIGVGVESCKILFLGAFPSHLVQTLFGRMYLLASKHSVTDRRTDGQTDDIVMPIADHAACCRIS